MLLALAGLGLAPLAAAQQAADGGLTDIVVTATKQRERLQDVPASITAFTATAIENAGINRAIDFIGMTPNLTAVEANNPGDLRITIRGDAQTLNTDPPVAVVIDGVVLSGATGLNTDLLDVEQIEVLKGPQGYLYGRNAISGAINIVTKAPTNDFDGMVQVGGGNGDTKKGAISLGGPIIPDKLLFRVSGSYRDTGGYYDNTTLHNKVDPYTERSGRLRLDWRITDALKAEAIVQARHIDASATNYTSQSEIPSLQTAGAISGIVDANFADAPFVFNVHDYSKKDDDLFSLKLEYETGFGKFTSVSAYESEKDVFASDGYPYLPVQNGYQFNQRQNQSVSEELRFASPAADRLHYVVGAYFLNIRQTPYLLATTGLDNNDGLVPDFTGIITGPVNTTQSFSADNVYGNAYAVFGTLYYALTPDIDILLASRFDQENKRAIDVAPVDFSPTAGAVRRNQYQAWQPKIDIDYKFAPGSLAYLTYAVGFKAGGFNLAKTPAVTGGAVPSEYPAEKARDVEGGLKSELFDRRLLISAAGFYTEKDNSQLFQFIPAGSLNAVTVIDQIDIKGFELEFTARPLPGLSIAGGIGYTNATIDTLKANPGYAGNRAPYVPEIKTTLGATYTYPITEDWALTANADWEHWGDQYWDTANSAFAHRNDLDFLNARVSLSSNNWTLAGWVKNLTDVRYNSDVIVILAGPGINTQAVFKGPPRTFGADLTYRF